MHKQLSKDFNSSIFDSKDLPGSGIGMSMVLISKLQIMKDYLGMPIKIRSGFRTKLHNARVGGKVNSEHLTGEGVDVICLGSEERFYMLQAAAYAGFDRIGVKGDMIHLGVSTTLPTPRFWLY